MKIKWVILLSTILVFFLVPTINTEASSTALLKEIEGEVFVQKVGGKKEIKAYDGMSIHLGDTIQTGEGASVKIDFGDNNQATLGQYGKITIAELVTDRVSIPNMIEIASANGKKVGVKQESGGLWSKIKGVFGAGDRHRVETSTAVMGVRGTLFLTVVNQESGNERVAVVDGELGIERSRASGVTDPLNEPRVRPGQEQSLDEDSSEPIAINYQETIESIDDVLVVEMITDAIEAAEERTEEANKEVEELDGMNDLEKAKRALEMAASAELLSRITETIVQQTQRSNKVEAINSRLQIREQSLEQLAERAREVRQNAEETRSNVEQRAREVGVSEDDIEQSREETTRVITEIEETTTEQSQPTASPPSSGGGGGGGSTGSGENHVISPPTTLTPPTEISTESITSGYEVYNRITWEETLGADEGVYQISRNTTNSMEGATIVANNISPTETEYIDYSVTPGAEYYYFVSVRNVDDSESISISTDGTYVRTVLLACSYERESLYVHYSSVNEYNEMSIQWYHIYYSDFTYNYKIYINDELVSTQDVQQFTHQLEFNHDYEVRVEAWHEGAQEVSVFHEINVSTSPFREASYEYTNNEIDVEHIEVNYRNAGFSIGDREVHLVLDGIETENAYTMASPDSIGLQGTYIEQNSTFYVFLYEDDIETFKQMESNLFQVIARGEDLEYKVTGNYYEQFELTPSINGDTVTLTWEIENFNRHYHFHVSYGGYLPYHEGNTSRSSSHYNQSSICSDGICSITFNELEYGLHYQFELTSSWGEGFIDDVLIEVPENAAALLLGIAMETNVEGFYQTLEDLLLKRVNANYKEHYMEQYILKQADFDIEITEGNIEFAYVLLQELIDYVNAFNEVQNSLVNKDDEDFSGYYLPTGAYLQEDDIIIHHSRITNTNYTFRSNLSIVNVNLKDEWNGGSYSYGVNCHTSTENLAYYFVGIDLPLGEIDNIIIKVETRFNTYLSYSFINENYYKIQFEDSDLSMTPITEESAYANFLY
ncbi:FecR domain-containing protein [Bacillus sp. FJAT-45350]|uniref:FecR domain-containing protein n=1 Tax=Bacillus sp. FJAT-45350 TaxID=2011014 RepID=UPI000BB7DB97|nr:FecR domain-containing protein [Bacillus sp. FJAT-45350]